MEVPLQEGEAEGAPPPLAQGERSCAAEGEPPATDQQEAAAAQATALQQEQQRQLWHLFQRSATAVAQLYQEPGWQVEAGASPWDPFQHAAVAVTSLYKASGDVQRQSFDLGVQVGRQRRVGDVLAWAQKGRSLIRREDLIGFLCGKGPATPPAPSAPRPAAKPAAAAVGGAVPAEAASSAALVDLQPFHEAIALHGFERTLAAGAPSPQPHHSDPGGDGGGGSGSGSATACRKITFLDDDALSPANAEEVDPGPEGAGIRKRPSSPGAEALTDLPSPKRNRML
ncbi:HUWE1-associated protein modifying stress responses 2 [Tenrec ecaudatus]|uniref:HUWE1-associated protein modifying stress responses 2 n=1 Tax=Tenrec ecaudatus TaxID=94439 RepID=UPI003F5AB998